MESEMLRIFDDQGNPLGTATRSEVHKKGHWHETFHCWFTERVGGKDYLVYQIRSSDKKDYPDLLDITAAGHILAHETKLDGLREVEEELGVKLSFVDIVSLGVIKGSLVSADFIDKELCHVYVYNQHVPNESYHLQEEEVSGIVKASLDDIEKLWFGDTKEISVEGFQIDDCGAKKLLSRIVSKKDFVLHEDAYINRVIQAIRSLGEDKIEML